MSMVAKPSKPDDIVVFSILREAQCDECGAELGPGALLKKEGETALCLSCADLAHLVFLAQGNAALTRRASKYSTSPSAMGIRFTSKPHLNGAILTSGGLLLDTPGSIFFST